MRAGPRAQAADGLRALAACWAGRSWERLAAPELEGWRGAVGLDAEVLEDAVQVIATSQCSSTTLYQVSYHIR